MSIKKYLISFFGDKLPNLMPVISGGYPGYPRPPPYLPMAGPVYWPGPGYPSPPISPPGGGSYYLPGPLLSTPASSLSSLSTVAVSPGPPHPASPPPPASQQHNTLVHHWLHYLSAKQTWRS